MDENRKRIDASGVRDRVIVWGVPGCDLCREAAARLRALGLSVEEQDLEKDLPLAPPVLRAGIMAVYADIGAAPVIQINNRPGTIAEAIETLGIFVGREKGE